MAPKKKKKSAANPARAVATTSIASKPKVDKKLDSTDPSETGSTATPATPVTGDAAPSPAAPAGPPKELHQLSPEELELQLERNELQLLVEKHAQRVRKESSRHLSRIQTDRRILRTQAQYLPTREWLPEHLMLQMLDLINDEVNEDFSSPEHKHSIRSLSEEDAILRLWTLSQVLTDMGFSKERVRQMLVLICRNPPPLDASTQIWGLQESLDWFSVNCPAEELPPYETQAVRQGIDTSNSSRSSKCLTFISLSWKHELRAPLRDTGWLSTKKSGQTCCIFSFLEARQGSFRRTIPPTHQGSLPSTCFWNLEVLFEHRTSS